jgi:hypothetical protein
MIVENVNGLIAPANPMSVEVFNDYRAEFKAANDKGMAFCFGVDASYDYTAADTILSVRNNSNLYDLVITRFQIRGSTETDVQVHHPTATFTNAGTAGTAIALNTKMRGDFEPPVNVTRDETGNTQGDVIALMRISADTIYDLNLLENPVILGQDDAVGVDFVTDGTEAYAIAFGYFRPKLTPAG